MPLRCSVPRPGAAVYAIHRGAPPREDVGAGYILAAVLRALAAYSMAVLP